VARRERRLGDRAPHRHERAERRGRLGARLSPPQEGDLDNARYWYRKAKRPEATGPLEAEWETIVDALLDKS
jgi:hypothetical protein